MLGELFKTAGLACGIYGLLCFIRILLSWFPQSQYTGVGRFLCGLCDPYLNLFRRLRFLRIGILDLSPTLAIGLLAVGYSVFGSLALYGRFSFALLLSAIIGMVWSIVGWLLGAMILILIIRLIIILVSGDFYSPFWDSLDRALGPLLFRICSTFTGGRRASFRTALIVGILSLAVVRIAGEYVTRILCNLALKIPF